MATTSRIAYAGSSHQSYGFASVSQQHSHDKTDFGHSSLRTSASTDERIKRPRTKYEASLAHHSSSDDSLIIGPPAVRLHTYSEYTHSRSGSGHDYPLVIRSGPQPPGGQSNSGGIGIEGAVVGGMVAYCGMYLAAATIEMSTAAAAATIPVAMAALPYAAMVSVTTGAAYGTWQGAKASRRCFEPYIVRVLRQSRQTADLVRHIAVEKARHVVAVSAEGIAATGSSMATSPVRASASIPGLLGTLPSIRGTSPWASTAALHAVDDTTTIFTVALPEDDWEEVQMGGPGEIPMQVLELEPG